MSGDNEVRPGERLDVYVSRTEGVTRSAAQRLIEGGGVMVNGLAAPKNYRLRQGDEVETELPEPTECDAAPQAIPLDVVYEDDALIVINKPQGMVVHPAPGNPDGTLVNALLHHCGASLSGIGGVVRPGIVHRIDRDTSGLLVAAKTDAAHLALSEQLKTHGVRREYEAVVIGGFKDDEGTVNAPIGRHPVDRKRMAVVTGGREAVTHYRVGERFSGYTLLFLTLETGRTHQIRVHCAKIGHPVLGDPVYGGVDAFVRRHPALFHGQALHARRLTFIHPSTGAEVSFEAPPPDNFTECLKILRG